MVVPSSQNLIPIIPETIMTTTTTPAPESFFSFLNIMIGFFVLLISALIYKFFNRLQQRRKEQIRQTQDLQRQQQQRIKKIRLDQEQTPHPHPDFDDREFKCDFSKGWERIDVFGDGCVIINLILIYNKENIYYKAILEDYFYKKPKSSCNAKVKKASAKQIFKHIRRLLLQLEKNYEIRIPYLTIENNGHVYTLDINKRIVGGPDRGPDIDISISSVVLDLLIGDVPFYLKLGRNFFYEIPVEDQHLRLKSRRLAKKIMELIHTFAEKENIVIGDDSITLSDYLRLKKQEFLEYGRKIETTGEKKMIEGVIALRNEINDLSQEYVEPPRDSEFYENFDHEDIDKFEKEIDRITTSNSLSIKEKIRILTFVLSAFTLTMSIHIDKEY